MVFCFSVIILTFAKKIRMELSTVFKKARLAASGFDSFSRRDEVLNFLADMLESETEWLLAANRKDLDRMDAGNPKYDRLKLTGERIAGMAADMRRVAALPSPLDRLLEEHFLANDLQLQKVTVPIGVIGVIYEARPNVTCDVFSLCFKSGNACVLKGGSDAVFSNEALMSLIHRALAHYGANSSMVTLLPSDRASAHALLTARGWVDVVIPRGSRELIDFVCENARIPVIETGAGVVHTYLDMTCQRDMAAVIINNAKTRRVSVCNALDCLIVHKRWLKELSIIMNPLADAHVSVYADELSYDALKGRYPDDLLFPADSSSFGTEFEDYKIAVKTVNGIREALAHIERYGSKHSEAIISDDKKNIELFLKHVDAAAVYANASTAFTDGAQFGMGAEIGISTQKLHARGPMGLKELTSYKWVIRGNGQIRPR
ncbi:MAG: glutamate-5-semialdehyde dehydrogenase [Bacteroidales bacterium]|nr:glutamate-5-semialdehyde dehydrogenase [Bacteroidales bacterium]